MKEVKLLLLGFDTVNNNFIALPEPMQVTMDYSDLPIELKYVVDEYLNPIDNEANNK